jgi:flagellar motor component MotA
MSDEKNIAQPARSEVEQADRPFGYLDPDSETAMICEHDPAYRGKISGELKKMGFAVVEPGSSKEALKFMRFHIFDVIFIDENFDVEASGINNVLKYLEGLSMTTRRQSFLALISSALNTLDNMTAYNKSVNLIINGKEIDEAGQILKRALTEHNAFYHVYKESLRKHGKG